MSRMVERAARLVASLLAISAALANPAALHAPQAVGNPDPAIERLDTIRERLLERDADDGTTGDPVRQEAQWFNWGNWPNWNNWGNWPNWPNFWRNF